VLPRRNHQATATVAIIVGTMIASMIAVELMRICFSAEATGPTGSRMPRLQAVRVVIRRAASVMRRILPQWLQPAVFTNPPRVDA